MSQLYDNGTKAFLPRRVASGDGARDAGEPSSGPPPVPDAQGATRRDHVVAHVGRHDAAEDDIGRQPAGADLDDAVQGALEGDRGIGHAWRTNLCGLCLGYPEVGKFALAVRQQ